jgi:4-hydroxybenzoate polyprenyltransferase
MVNHKSDPSIVAAHMPESYPSRARAVLRLIGPVQILTEYTAVLAGFAIAGTANWRQLAWLLLAVTCLFAGISSLTRVFQAHQRAGNQEWRFLRGTMAEKVIAAAGGLLVALGVATASAIGKQSGLLAMDLALVAMAYHVWGKQRLPFDPILLGFARGLTLLLGISAAQLVLSSHWMLAVIPFTFAAALATLRLAEVDTRKWNLAAVLVLLGVAAGSLALAMLHSAPERLAMLPVLVLLLGMVIPGLWWVWRRRQAMWRGTPRMDILSLIVLDAALAIGFAGPIYGLSVLALLISTALFVRWE